MPMFRQEIRTSPTRIALALIAAVAAGAASGGLAFGVFELVSGQGPVGTSLDRAVSMAMTATLFSLPFWGGAGLVIGLPAFALLRRYGLCGWLAVPLAVAGLAGLGSAGLFMAMGAGGLADMGLALITMFGGLFAGAALRAVARRPDAPDGAAQLRAMEETFR